MPMVGAWSDGLDEYSAPFVKSMLFGEQVEYVNPEGSPITTIVPGKTKGRLCGGNLSLLAASLGTPYEIDTKGKILFIEEIGERPYKVDGMLTHLRNAGKFDDAAGIILGGFTDCADKEGTIGGLSLEDIYQELKDKDWKERNFQVAKGWTEAFQHFSRCCMENIEPQTANGAAGKLANDIAFALLESKKTGMPQKFKNN